MLEKICKELGVELNEEWEYKGKEYCIHEVKGFVYWHSGFGDWLTPPNTVYNALILGELKPVWKPKKGDVYYAPFIHEDITERYVFYGWLGCEEDKWFLENNMVFKSKEQAIEATNKMLDALKEYQDE